jgi:hypothetical protein
MHALNTRTTASEPRPKRRCKSCGCYLRRDNTYLTCAPCDPKLIPCSEEEKLDAWADLMAEAP